MNEWQKQVQKSDDNEEVEGGQACHHHYFHCNAKARAWHDGGTLDAKGCFSMALNHVASFKTNLCYNHWEN